MVRTGEDNTLKRTGNYTRGLKERKQPRRQHLESTRKERQQGAHGASQTCDYIGGRAGLIRGIQRTVRHHNGAALVPPAAFRGMQIKCGGPGRGGIPQGSALCTVRGALCARKGQGSYHLVIYSTVFTCRLYFVPYRTFEVIRYTIGRRR